MVRIAIISEKDTERTHAVELLVDENESLYKALVKASLAVEAPCGGNGTCGKCLVKVEGVGEVRSCHTMPFEGMCVVLPEIKGENPGVMVDGVSANSEIKPSVRAVHVSLEKPSLNDQRSDLCRIEDATGARVKDLSLMAYITPYIRENNFEATAIISGDEIIDIKNNSSIYGAAVDIGTTTVGVKLISLADGKTVGVKGALNVQRSMGADVITRIEAARTPYGREMLPKEIRGQINDMLTSLCEENGISINDIYDIVCVGNTTMIAMLLGLDATNIAASPFIPPVLRGITVKSGDLGIRMGRGATLRTLDMISAYVGADTFGCMLACGMDKSRELSLMIDIGTNGELLLGCSDKIISCSTAAGPAFEGAHIDFGMGGVAGAIDNVIIDDDVHCTTIGNEAACGICGSGIVDAVSELLRIGVIDQSGRMCTADEVALPQSIVRRMVEYNNIPAFLLMSEEEGAKRDVYVTQKDVREIQLAKSAIASGIMVMADEYGCSVSQIKRLYLAGGFGNYINIENACKIGLLPMVLKDVISPVGNAALQGAVDALLNKDVVNRAQGIRGNIKYVELSARYDFQDYFIDNMEF